MKWGLVAGTVGLLAGAAAYGTYRYWHPLPPKARKGKKHIVCIGDSITYGAGVVPQEKWRSYPAYLQMLLGKQYQVMNFGLSGRTLTAAGDMPYRNEPHFSSSLRIPAPYYILMLGSNDAREKWWDTEQFREACVQIFMTYRDKGSVIVMTPPKVFPVQGKEDISFGIQDALVRLAGQIIKETADVYSIPVVDLYTFTQNHPEWFPDGVHPNAHGNREIANYIYTFCKAVFS